MQAKSLCMKRSVQKDTTFSV